MGGSRGGGRMCGAVGEGPYVGGSRGGAVCGGQ